MELVEIIQRQIPFSISTYGEGKRTVGICEHIRSELYEIENSPDDVSEWVDVILLAIDGAWRAGFSAEEIDNAVVQKQQINIARRWNVPGDESAPIFHVKESE